VTEVGCPFCDPLPADRVFYHDDVVSALWDGFPVSPGHALLITRRHVADWFEATDEERSALTRALSLVKEEAERRYAPDGFNVGVNVGAASGQTIFHLHVHLIPRYRGDVPDPRGGVRHVIPSKGNYLAASGSEPETLPSGLSPRALVRGGVDDPLLPHILANIDESERVDIAAAFVLGSGVRRLEAHLRDLLGREGRVRLLTGDYLDVTDPDALLRLLDLEGQIELRVFETKGTSFHPKAYVFYRRGGTGVAYVGSSNLTESALTSGVEWNYRVVSSDNEEGFSEVTEAFEELFSHPSTRTVGTDWIAEYRRRRRVRVVAARPAEVEDEAPLPPPEPHEVQREALAALEATRRAGNSAGLVVLATGLGKTWLSAFDSSSPEFSRVLFVAHREEILVQALGTYRRVRPQAVLGHYTGAEKNPAAEVVFASIQTLGRRRHLEVFGPEDFDYVVVDEFHHASAATYRRLIDYFKPRFLLGLTATPERTDGGDLLALCQENLVYRCDLFEGIRRELLSPFHYFGVPDEVNYANIPWRSNRFDEEALTQAVATRSRAENALGQYRRRGGKRTLAFCVSQKHADFMAEFFRAEGIRAVAVHSGENSAPRATSLEKLEAGELDCIFAVDIFNEGLDLPHIDTVMMLRPTGSRVLWLQQFGRGLRRAEGKECLTVIDYIGNHRTFLDKPRTLFELGARDADVLRALQLVQSGQAELPPGCEVTYELEAIDILKGLLRLHQQSEALRLYYEDFRERHGMRPRAVEAFHEGYNPRSARRTYGSWLGFVRSIGDLTEGAGSALDRFSVLLDALEVTPMTKSFKMLVLLAMLNRDRFPGEISIEELTEGFGELVRRSARLRNDVGPTLDDGDALRKLIEEHPVEAWVGGRGTGGTPFFSYAEGIFSSTMRVESTERAELQELVRELVDWRLAEYLQRSPEGGGPGEEIVCKVSHSGGRPIIFLDRNKYPYTPEGWTDVDIEGEEYSANFVTVAVNVIRRAGSEQNELPALMRRWFGPDAGLPGTNFFVALRREGGRYNLTPIKHAETDARLELWRNYSREQIAPHFGEQFNTARWNSGFVTLPGTTVLLITIEKEGMGSTFQYQDYFLSPDLFEMHSQNRTSQASAIGQGIQYHRERGIHVHLFVRNKKKVVGGRTAPFVYCGEVEFAGWEGDRPITIRWKLSTPLPERLQKLLMTDDGD
jgi:superfamily II DNA or RNA helicase/diadenosine tetraphosphate (Ap4A) HIT family hydrolase/HKD family nuclease